MWMTAFLVGFAGSLHCLVMCSPLAMAVTNFRAPYIYNRLLYNAGRIFTYGALGWCVSSFGSFLYFTGFQNTFSILLGASLILIGIAGVNYVRIPLITPLVQKLSNSIKVVFARTLKEKTIFSLLLLGMLNGILPCGLTYLALSYCLTFSVPGSGLVFMIFFGLGTLPVMLGFPAVIRFFTKKHNLNFQRLSTIAIVGLGVLLISRAAFSHHAWKSTASKKEEIVICK
jgi:uncharacterized protein